MSRANQSNRTGHGVAPGFTLVELLVVMGIIAVLIGILIPVVNSVRKSAYAADSRNQIKNIGNAIDRYYTDFSAYPGIFSNIQTRTTSTNPATPAPVAPTGSVGNLSSSENLVLTLCGGNGGTAAAPTYIANDVGRGVLSYNTIGQKRYAAYLEVTPQMLSIPHSLLDPAATFGMGEPMVGANTGVPEFIDRFPGAMAIVYMRANTGAPAQGGVIVNSSLNTQYDLRDLAPYFKSNTVPTVPPKVQGATSADFTDWNTYFANTGITGTAKRQDSYLLISPGQDRTYGTADDICNFQF